MYWCTMGGANIYSVRERVLTNELANQRAAASNTFHATLSGERGDGTIPGN